MKAISGRNCGFRGGQSKTTAALGDILSRIQCEYREMPGMCVTLSQAQRLWQLDPSTCLAALTLLVERGILRRTPRGAYVPISLNESYMFSVTVLRDDPEEM